MIRRAFSALTALLLLCAGAPAQGQAEGDAGPLRAQMIATLDALLASVRDGDAARYGALVSPAATFTDRAAAANGPNPLTAERLRRFAAECRRVGERGFVPTAPPTHIATYECNGHRGFELYAAYGDGGRWIAEIRMDGPGPTAAEWAQDAQLEAAEVAREIVLRREVPLTLDRLFDAVRRGDQAAFDALIAPAVPESGYNDWRDGHYRQGPLTIARLLPMVERCRRSDEPYSGFQAGPMNQGAHYLCDGRPFYTLISWVSGDGASIVRLTAIGSRADRPQRRTARDRALDREWAAQRTIDERISAELVRAADAFLAAARDGDAARFQALVGPGIPTRGPLFGDWRNLIYSGPSLPLTIERMRPFALACRREASRPEILSSGPTYSQGAYFTCGGEPHYYFTIGFEADRTRIAYFDVQDPDRPIPIH